MTSEHMEEDSDRMGQTISLGREFYALGTMTEKILTQVATHLISEGVGIRSRDSKMNIVAS